MEGQISQEIMDERLERLMTVQNQIAQGKRRSADREDIEVLIENQDGLTGYYHGRGIHSAPDGIDGLIKFKVRKPISRELSHGSKSPRRGITI